MSVENAEYFPGDKKLVWGEIEIELLDQPAITYCDSPFNGSNAVDGEEYIVAYTTRGRGNDGKLYGIEWRFCVIKGEEPEEEDALPWYDDENIYSVAEV